MAGSINTEQSKHINAKQAAVVTGASSGIGRAICRVLYEKGFAVFGIGRTFGEEDLIKQNEAFTLISCDIQKTDQLLSYMKSIRKQFPVAVLVNCAGVGYYGLHEELNAKKIQEMVRVNVEAPMILTQFFLRDLKKNSGWIFQISSVTAEKSNPHGAAYGATKAALTSFSHSLFDEARKYGVKVVNIEPDMTATNLYRNADFTADEDLMAHIEPEEVASLVSFAMDQREGLCITDFTVKPQFHRLGKNRKG